MFLAIVPLFLEFFYMVFHRDHRTSLAFPPQRPTSTSGEISLAPTDSLSLDPTDGSAKNAFV